MPCIDEQALSTLTNFEGAKVPKRYVDASPLGRQMMASGHSPDGSNASIDADPIKLKNVLHELETP